MLMDLDASGFLKIDSRFSYKRNVSDGSGIFVVCVKLFFVINKITHLGKVQMPDRRIMLCQYLKRVNGTYLVIAGLLA